MKYCSQIEHTIKFNPYNIEPCNVNGVLPPPVYIKIEHMQNYELDFKKRRQELFAFLNDSSIKKRCDICCYREDKKTDNSNDKINLIILRHWSACNCDCIYCTQKMDGEKGKPLYNPAPIIENLYKQDLIDRENLVVNFHGGDIGALKNFDELVNLFKKYGYGRIDFSTNNIIYQPNIEASLREQKCTLSFSLDCGSRETYKIIKRVDKFDVYIKNLRKYVQATENKRSINVHYILVKGINDNKKEIKKFLKLMHKIGVGQVGLRLDHRYMNKWLVSPVPLQYCPEYLSEIILYFFKQAKKYKMFQEMDYKEQNITLLKIFRTNKLQNKNTSNLQKKNTTFFDRIKSIFKNK